MGYSIFSHSHLHLVECETNGQRKMVIVNLQKAFDIINHTILLKKMYSVGFSATQLLGFLVWAIALFTSFQVSIKNKWKYQLWSSTTIERVSLLPKSLVSQKFAHSPTWKNCPQETPPPSPPNFYSLSPPKVNFPH